MWEVRTGATTRCRTGVRIGRDIRVGLDSPGQMVWLTGTIGCLPRLDVSRLRLLALQSLTMIPVSRGRGVRHGIAVLRLTVCAARLVGTRLSRTRLFRARPFRALLGGSPTVRPLGIEWHRFGLR